jgi:hypothetical protein
MIKQEKWNELESLKRFVEFMEDETLACYISIREIAKMATTIRDTDCFPASTASLILEHTEIIQQRLDEFVGNALGRLSHARKHKAALKSAGILDDLEEAKRKRKGKGSRLKAHAPFLTEAEWREVNENVPSAPAWRLLTLNRSGAALLSLPDRRAVKL